MTASLTTFLAVYLLLIVCAVSASKPSMGVRFDGDKVYRVAPTTRLQLDELRVLQSFPISNGDVDFWTEPMLGRTVDIRVRAKAEQRFLNFLARRNIKSTLEIDNLQEAFDFVDELNSQRQKEQGNNSIIGTFASHKDINDWLDMQCKMYPSMTKCGSWGSSYERRDMRYIKIGKPSMSKKKAVYIISGMHAREWLGPATTIWVINQLLADYGHNKTVTRLVNMYDWYFEPLVNPDGYEFTRASAGNRLWRKTRRPTSDPSCIGVDGNRNFAFHWMGGGHPCDETYAGEKAFSQNETNNLRLFMLQQNSSQEGLVFVSVHTYSKIWLLPYGYAKGAKPADYNELLRAGTVGVNALMAVNNQKWEIGNIADLLYPATGSSADWFKGLGYTKYSYGLELRGNSFVIPASQIVPSGKEVYAGFIAAISTMR